MTAKQLTDSILQMAIQGKLVPQDSNDEHASVLLERIRDERRRLVKEGKLRAIDNLEKPIKEQEIPYSTPQGWEWIRLNYVSSIARGGSPRPIKEYITDAPNGVNWIKISDTEIGGKYIYKTKEKIKPEGVSRSRFVHKNDFLLTNSMSLGRPYILKTDGCIHDGWLVISLEKDSYDQDFMYYLLSSAFAKKSFADKAAGAVVKNLNIDKVAESIFPLPPLSEQRRIVEKIEEYLPIIKEYGEAYGEAAKMDAELPDKLKKSILQEAIMGKLGTQDPSDEPASSLLEDIRAEKKRLVKEGILKKKDLIEVPVNDDEVPFNIPESWEWYRIGQLSSLYSGDSINKDVKERKYTKVKGRWYIATKDVGFNHTINYDNGIYIPENDEPYFKIARKGSILMCIEGGSAGRKIGLIDRDVCFGNKLCCFYPYIINNEYLFYYLQSSCYREIFNNKKKGIIGGVSINLISKLLIPLPPLAEQHRIVQKIEELYAEIDNMTIENNINISETEEIDNE